MLKSERQHLYHIYLSLRRMIRLKKSLLGIFKILGLFFNPLTADDKYSLVKSGNLLQQFKMQLSKKRKIFSESIFFFPYFKFRFNVEHFQKKWPWQHMYFWTYVLPKTWLDNCLKSPVSEDPSTSDMVNGPKHCWNLNDSTFTILIDPCEGNSGGKSLS